MPKACWKKLCFLLWFRSYAKRHHRRLLVYLSSIVLDRNWTVPKGCCYNYACRSDS
uniref:Uncharacterized protein n=1 Tax=Salix viminalis TaxID=40686 RepID=A0A6N2L5W8_SALVM